MCCSLYREFAERVDPGLIEVEGHLTLSEHPAPFQLPHIARNVLRGDSAARFISRSTWK